MGDIENSRAGFAVLTVVALIALCGLNHDHFSSLLPHLSDFSKSGCSGDEKGACNKLLSTEALVVDAPPPSPVVDEAMVVALADAVVNVVVDVPLPPPGVDNPMVVAPAADMPRDGIYRMRWLHIPKAGTSFLSSVVSVSCPKHMQAVFNQSFSSSQYFIGLQKVLPNLVSSTHFPKGLRTTSSVRLDYVLRQHCNVSPHFTTYHEGLPLNMSSVDLASVAVMVREPTARTLSGFKYHLHDLKFGSKQTEALVNSSHSPVLFYAINACGIQTRLITGASTMVMKKRSHGGSFRDTVPASYNAHQESFDPFCSVATSDDSLRFLNKFSQTKDAEKARETWDAYIGRGLRLTAKITPATKSLIEEAERRLDSFGFVGLTEQWNRSVCLFHKQFGGSPSTVELGNSRRQVYNAYDEANKAILDGTSQTERFVDVVDSMMYKHATTIFLQRAAKFGC